METNCLLNAYIIFYGVYCWKREKIMKLIEAIALRVSGLINDKDNLTAYELAKQAGMPRSTVWKIINPDLTRVKTAKIDTVYQIAATLGMNLKEFFDDAVFDDISD